jgi:hypothetical protein
MTNHRWRGLYEEAVLELNVKLLKERIDIAMTAIDERLLELHRSTDNSRERRMLADAKETLECLR